jgi:hypothetical protein
VYLRSDSAAGVRHPSPARRGAEWFAIKIGTRRRGRLLAGTGRALSGGVMPPCVCVSDAPGPAQPASARSCIGRSGVRSRSMWPRTRLSRVLSLDRSRDGSASAMSSRRRSIRSSTALRCSSCPADVSTTWMLTRLFGSIRRSMYPARFETLLAVLGGRCFSPGCGGCFVGLPGECCCETGTLLSG